MSRYSQEKIREREKFFYSNLHECFFYNKVYHYDSLMIAYVDFFKISIKDLKKNKSVHRSLFIVLLTILPVKYSADEIKLLFHRELGTIKANKYIVDLAFHKHQSFRQQVMRFSEQHLTKSTRIKLIRLLK